MKKNLLFLVLFVLACSFSCSQEALLQFTKSYFRSNPFIGEFSSFLKHLLNDPDLKDKKTWTRTDTSLFYFSGVFTHYNPFFFKPKKIEIVLQEVPVQYNNSLPADTILIYQLLAYVDGNSNGESEVKKEFAKIHRRYNVRFHKSNFQDMVSDSVIQGGVRNYFISSSDIAPVSVAWGKVKDEYILNLILRIKRRENETILPATFYYP